MSYQSSSNSGGSSTGGIAATFLTILLIVGGVGLRIVARGLRNSSRNSSYSSSTSGPSSSSSSWGWGTSGTTWNDVVAEHDRCLQEAIQDITALQSKYQAQRLLPADEFAAFMTRCHEKDARIHAKSLEAQRNQGNPPASVVAHLNTEPTFPPWPQSDDAPGLQPPPFQPSPPPALANSNFEAERLARQQQREAEVAANNARLAQMQADQEAQRQQRLAEQQARDQEMRNRLANLGNAPAAPAAQPIAPPQQPAVEETPGFAVTAITQVKPRDTVFVKQQDKWFPALVQAKRGLIIQVRYSTNGVVEMVTLDRIRLQNEPVAKAESDVPAALRIVGQAKPAARNPEPEDDALFVAKPNKEPPVVVAPEGAPPPTDLPAAKPAGDAPTANGMRIWTDDTGDFKVEAELLTFEFDLVQLKRRDGKVLTLRIEKLSTADQALVREKFK